MNSAACCHEIVGCPGLYVDAFRAKFSQQRQDLSNAFILTHYHGDHYNGLPKEGRYQGPALIHCTSVTASLLRNVHEVPSQFVVNHDYGHTWEFPIPSLLSEDTGNVKASRSTQPKVARVTFLDANHCPGAAIVFIELPDGTCHLHTGDMRYHNKMKRYPLLQQAAMNKKLDLVYLDTTYGHPKHAFLPQETAIDTMSSQVKALLGSERTNDESSNILVLMSCYSIGKEKVLWESSRRSNQLVYVTDKKFKMLKCIKTNKDQETDASSRIIERCTLDPSMSDLHVIPMGTAGEVWPYFVANFNACADYALTLEKKYQKVVAFMPTGWAMASNWNKKNAVSAKQIKREDRCLDIEVRLISYSEHSAFSELCEFVEFLRPRKVIPTVFSDANDCRRIEGHFRHMIDSTRAKKSFFKSMANPSASRSVDSSETQSSVHRSHGNPKRQPSSPDECIEISDDEPDVQENSMDDSSQKRKRDHDDGTSERVTTLVSMGFAIERVKEALKGHKDNVELALDALLSAKSEFRAGKKQLQSTSQDDAVRTLPNLAQASPSIARYFVPKKR